MSRGTDASRPHVPRSLTDDERARFTALNQERFRDTEFQRWAQSHRSHESLQDAGRAGWRAMVDAHGREALVAAGKLGWAATVAKHGEEYAWDRAADTRRDHPTAPEHAMIRLLAELGQRDDGTYRREHKVAPRTYVDFAWPERHKIVEVFGPVHFGPFDRDGAQSARDAARIARIQALGWRVMVVRDTDLAPATWLATRQRVNEFLDLAQRPLIAMTRQALDQLQSGFAARRMRKE